MKQLIDDRNDITSYQYDTLDRETRMEFHDGSTRDYQFNPAGNVIKYIDENGSEFDNTFDALGRRTQCDITKAAGVLGTDQQTFEYDGLSRMTEGVDSVSAADATVGLSYDSLSRVVEDAQTFDGNTRQATNEKFTSYPVTQFKFPNGRQISNTFDLLYRRIEVGETGGPAIAEWKFFGPGRVAEMKTAANDGGGNDLYCTHLNNDRTRSAIQDGETTPAWGNQSSDRLGFDGASRQITKRWLLSSINGTTQAYDATSAVVGQTTSYDKASNKLFERSLQAESRSNLYEPIDANGDPEGGYDSIDRLRQYQRGTLASGGGSVSSVITLPNTDESRTYDLDGLGNWKETVFTPVGGSETTQVRNHNKLNQITRTIEGATQTDFTYDGTTGASNGNLQNDGIRLYEWDAFNRLVKVSKTPDTPVTIGEYTYDAFGRRIRKDVQNGGLSGSIPNGETDYVYHGGFAQCCEERQEISMSDTPIKQYVWGIYIDELIQQKNLIAINNFAANDELYPLCDTLYRTVGLADSSGVIREAYDTDAYGNTLIFRNGGTPPGAIAWSDGDTQVVFPTCDFIFTGRRYDPESDLYFYRARPYIPSHGRFPSRDPLSYKSAINMYQFVGSRPPAALDPYGTEDWEIKATSLNDIPKATSIFGATDASAGAYSFEWLVDFTGYRNARGTGKLNIWYEIIPVTRTQKDEATGKLRTFNTKIARVNAFATISGSRIGRLWGSENWSDTADGLLRFECDCDGNIIKKEATGGRGVSPVGVEARVYDTDPAYYKQDKATEGKVVAIARVKITKSNVSSATFSLSNKVGGSIGTAEVINTGDWWISLTGNYGFECVKSKQLSEGSSPSFGGYKFPPFDGSSSVGGTSQSSSSLEKSQINPDYSWRPSSPFD